MNTTANGLKELHRLHINLREVQEQLERGPKQIRAREQIIARKKAELDAQKEQLKQLRMAADQKSLQLKTNESKILGLRAKLNQATSNREYDIFRSQIEADTMANSVLEDEILEALDKVDQAQVSLGRIDQEIAAAQADRERVAKDFLQVEADLKSQAAELESAIRETETTLPGDIGEKYKRLIQAHGPDALSAVEGRACSACYVGLTSQNIVELRSGRMVFCKSCGRLLYLHESDPE